MAFPRTIRNFNVFLDGVSYRGRATSAKMPDLKLVTAAHRGAGTDAPIGIDMGMEAMSAEITFAEWSPSLLSLFGSIQRLVLRPYARGEDGGPIDSHIATVEGLITERAHGELKPNDMSTLKLMVDVRYYKHEVNGKVLTEIDIENAARVIGGVDQLAEARRAMGI